MFRQQVETDVCIRLPWSGKLASEKLSQRNFNRLVRAYETARWRGPKTVIVSDETAISWIVTAEYSREGWELLWRYAG